MTISLIKGLLGGLHGSKATENTHTQAPASANSGININNLTSLFNSAYQAGLSAGAIQGGGAGGQPITINNNLNAGMYGTANAHSGMTGGVIPGLINGVSGHEAHGSGHSSANQGQASHSYQIPGNATSNSMSSAQLSTLINGAMGMTGGTGATAGTGSSSGSGGLFGDKLGGLMDLKSNLLGGLLGGGAGGDKLGGDKLGGLMDLKSNLLGGLLGGGASGSTSGSASGSNGGALGGFGNIAGSLLQGVHGFAEEAISATGLGGAFAPIDEAVVHPLLWDPLSKLTGFDVSKHPEGIADVSNPLNVKR